MTTPQDVSRARRLKALTAETHDELDRAIMGAGPFANLAGYARFLRVQHAFHDDVAPLYGEAALRGLLPDLAGRRRLELVRQDLVDLGAEPSPGTDGPFAAGAPVDTPTALGWLYVAEGSNLGAAFLLKAAARLGLDETRGARHLAAAPEGRANSWRDFTAALDAAVLSPEEEARVADGAVAAFRRVRRLVSDAFDGV